MSTALLINNLEYCWPGSRQAVINIPHWQIETGRHVFIYGPSGSGKSTLLNLIAGILRPQQGNLEVLGQSLTKLGTRARDRFRAQHIGFIFQQFNLVPYLSVAGNIALAHHFGSGGWFNRTAGRSQPDIKSAAAELLERLGLPLELLARKATELSVGQQQRVAVARALINRPQLIIADEPSSALDTDTRDDFLLLLLECAAQFNSTVIFVSHDKSMMAHFDDHVELSSLNKPRASLDKLNEHMPHAHKPHEVDNHVS
jgi:putative ABC transport system ATP-binding protein